MLDIFKRPRPQTPAGPGGPGDGTHRSHIFPKFLKRLSLVDRPTVLDLGRLSGGNIEIFARLGCRVQVEDLVSAADERSAARDAATGRQPGLAEGEPGRAGAGDGAIAHAGEGVAGHDLPTPPQAGAEGPAATGSAGDIAGVGAGGAAAGPPAAPDAARAAEASAAPPRPGARPSRRIVLPPRSLGRSAMVTGATGSSRAAAPSPTPLSAGFSYADGAFDAILAWDLINYYDPQSARRLASEMGRILKPGGMVYGWLHSRREQEPDGPRRFRIVDESHLLEEPWSGRPLPRHLYQNRDIEKMFAGQRIVEMYFLKNGVREMLLEKRAPGSAPPPATPAARPRPRFRIE